MGRLLQRNVWIEAGISLFLMAFFIFFYCNLGGWITESMPSTVSPAFFPSVVTVFLVAMSVLLVSFALRALYRMRRAGDAPCGLQKGGEEAGRFFALAGYVGLLFLYLAGLKYVGFVYSTPVIMLLIALMLGLRRWLMGLVAYVLFTLALNYVAFHYMQIILPTGILFE